jgi:hypothetical protein
MDALSYILNRTQMVFIQDNQFVNRRNFSLVDTRNFYGVSPLPGGTLRYWKMGLFIDEFPAEISQLRSIRADQIAMVKIFQAGFVGAGAFNPGGAIAVYLKDHEDMNKIEKPTTSEYIIFNGYSLTKEFYQPDYSDTLSAKSIEDNRTTLYWNPALFNDSESRSHRLRFFNNDFSRQLKIIVEGFDAEGKLIHAEKIIGSD